MLKINSNKYFFLFLLENRRFTVVLAQQAEHVVAVDFIERFIEKNRELNSHLNNIDFVHGDVTKLKFEEHQ